MTARLCRAPAAIGTHGDSIGPPYLPIRGEPVTEALKIPARQPTRVDAMLKQEFLAPLGVTQGELAKSMGAGRKTINELCGNRRGVRAETALLLARVLGITAECWLKLQLVNDLWLAEHNEVLAEKLKRARPANRFMEPPVTLAASVNAATRESGAPGQDGSHYWCCDSTPCV